MRNRVTYILFTFLAVIGLSISSCLKKDLEDFPTWEKNLIDNVYVEVRFNTSQTYNGQPVVGYQRLDVIKTTKDTIANTIALELGIPAAAGEFKSLIRQQVSLSNVFLYFDVSTAASMQGIDGTPNPGYRTDASKPLTYEVTAGNGSKRKWTITIAPLPLINKYDGNYVMTGTMVDYTNSSLTGKYPANVALVTQSENSVAMYDLDYVRGYGHRILSNGSDSYYGQFSPVFTFDSNNNVISVTNYFGQPSGNDRSAELDPSGENKWDPATKTLKVKYWMNQPGSTHRVAFDETFTWQD